MHFVGLNCTLLKINSLNMSEFLKNKCFVKTKSPNNVPKENVLVLLEFLKNKNFVKGKSPRFAQILEK
jgi:hypothetical protein